MARILALDPGQTLGFAVLDYQESNSAEKVWNLEGTGTTIAPVLRSSGKVELEMKPVKSEGFDWKKVPYQIQNLLDSWDPDLVVLEDYRVYGSKFASGHIGRRNLTSELIGAIEQEAAISQLEVIRLPASKKGSWPEARIRSMYPTALEAEKPHAFDAVLLGLVALEEKYDWKPIYAWRERTNQP